MSEPLRIALVAEGPTDGIVIEAALQAILYKRSFILKQIFPEGSDTFGEMGTGWAGVYRWCRQSARRGGALSGDALLFQNYDLLVLHLDADVAGDSYARGSITPTAADHTLPCAQPCPPAADTVNAIRRVLLSWCGETTTPPRTVFCTPSKSTEAWVIAALFPADKSMKSDIECYADPASRLAQQPAKTRIRKNRRDYQNRAVEFSEAWPRLAATNSLSEARRFQSEFSAAIP